MVLPGKLINLKPIPIYYENSSYHLTKKELNFIKKIEYYEARERGLFISTSASLLENKEVKGLKKFIVDKATAYAEKVLEIKNKIYLTQSWSTLNKQHGFHSVHYHPNTFISLVYYVKAEKGSLYFDVRRSSLQEGFIFDYSIIKYNVFNSERWTLHIGGGDIVIFPGHVCHGSNQNESTEPRITMGANFFLKGKIGREDRISNIKI